MALILVGLSHRGAPVDIRERVSFSTAASRDAADRARTAIGVREAVLLSTCNRTEFYAVEGDADAAPALWTPLSDQLGADATQYGYTLRDRDAVNHLFAVASGLDSMVLGEAQIHGQVRDAWENCRASSGAVLNRLFQSALSVAGRVRSETSISRGAASVSSAAVQLSKKIFGSLAGRRAMVLGAGEMAELALECFVGEGVRTAIVANRTFERAVELAARHGATAMHYDECWAQLADVDILLCSTASPRPVVHVEQVRPALAARGDRPLCILDIALPRDVDSAVGDLDNVFLYNIDDLQTVIAGNLERRRAELPTAEELIAAETERYWDWLSGLEAVPVLTQFRTDMEAIRSREFEEAMRRLKHLSPDDRAAVEHLTFSMMNKFLHEPSVRLKAAAANGRGLGIIDAARYLFGLRPGSRKDETREGPPESEARRY
ncbi:MAG TPA: glutamyl-tRNA reductase [Gemmatimonadaceae bacterium]